MTTKPTRQIIGYITHDGDLRLLHTTDRTPTYIEPTPLQKHTVRALDRLTLLLLAIILVLTASIAGIALGHLLVN